MRRRVEGMGAPSDVVEAGPSSVPLARTPRHAEIAGAGLAGLAAAVALARRGWTVRVHEAAPDLREIGAGLYVWENGLRVLEALGVLDDLAPTAHRVTDFDVVDERFRIVQRMSFSETRGERLWTVLRPELHKVLTRHAEANGVDIVTSSKVVGATPDGTIHLAGGRSYAADLVIAADGVNSTMRDSLGLLARKHYLLDGAIRLLVPRSAAERADPQYQRCVEYWKGTRRILYTPCSPDHVYLCFTARASDESAKKIPLDLDMWKREFPRLAFAIDRITPDTPARWDRFPMVKVRHWRRGRVAVIGDAAHAQPPNLGQGACLAMSNGLALGTALAGTDDVAAGLERWEVNERPIVKHTQRWTWLWGLASVAFPHRFQRARSEFISWLAHQEWVSRNLERTARHVPTGAPAD
jgi:2-polyprenyl-6-methoxyphenol hydroxylase-like FAD-dependent oxidoreductase